jgi:hypothetical protein
MVSDVGCALITRRRKLPSHIFVFPKVPKKLGPCRLPQVDDLLPSNAQMVGDAAIVPRQLVPYSSEILGREI